MKSGYQYSVSEKSRRRGPSWKRAGVFVSIDAEGLLSVDCGYVRPEDEAPAVVEPESKVHGGGEIDDESRANGSIQRAVITVGGSQVETADKDEDDTIKPLPDRLVTELTAHRTLALRNALANDPEVAFQAVLHNFVLGTFYRFASSSGCLEMAIRTPTFPALAPGLKESALRRKPSTSGTMVGKPVCRGAKKTCGSRRSTGKSRPRCLRIARHPRSTRSMSLPAAIMKAVSPRIVSVNGSAKPICWLVPSDARHGGCRLEADRR